MNTEGQYVYPQLLSPSKVTINEKGERKYKKLSKEEFIEEMKNSYYKASAAYLEGGTKFNQKITRFGMQNGKPVTYPQPYLEFIKETHTIPVNSEGEIVPLVNKIVYPSPSIFEEAKKTFKLSEDTKSQPPSKGSVSAKSNPVPLKNTKKSTDPAKTPVPNDVFNMIPFSELPAFLESLGLGALIPTYSEDTYNALLAELQSNPSFTPFVYTKDEQGVVRSDYVGKNPQASFLRAEITLNGKKYFVYFRPGSHTTGVNIGAVMTEGNVSFTTQIPQPTQTQTLPEVPTTTGGKLENVRFQNKDYKVELVQQEDGTFQVANIFNPDGKSIPLQTATGISVMMLLDDEALGKKDTGFMSVNDLMNAANQTPQRPSAPSKPAPKTPTNTVFTEDESQQAKENKDSCAKGLGEKN
jgi:hypothetical protein